MPHSEKYFTLTVDDHELATILAALRFHQDENLQVRNIPDHAIKGIATDCDSLEPLNFDEVGKLCERMNASKETNLARIIYDAYPHSDLLPVDPDRDCHDLQTLLAKVNSEDIGDSLFKFMVVEIIEGGESTLDGANRVLERTREDVEAVLQALPYAK